MGRRVWDRLYRALDAYVEVSRERPDELAHEEARRWFERRPDWKFYKGAFAPCFKDANGDSHGTDRKQTFQLCEMYYRFLNEQRPELLEGDEFRHLVDGAMAAMYSVHAAIQPLVVALSGSAPQLYRALNPVGALPPVSLRLLRYERNDGLAIRPHVDKSGLTVILDSDDPPDRPNLILGPLNAVEPVKLSSFVPAVKGKNEALMFFGAGLRAAGFEQCAPLPHTVAAVKTAVRHSAVFHWFLPNLDTDAVETKVQVI